MAGSILFFIALWAAAVVHAYPEKATKPPVSLPLTRHLNVTGPVPMAQKDQARANALLQGATGNVERRGSETDLLNYSYLYYTVYVCPFPSIHSVLLEI